MKFNKEDIIRVAFNEFMINGYSCPIIEILHKKLGMSKGALYRHFKNKNDLFIKVIDQYFFNVFERIIYKKNIDITALGLINQMHRRQILIQALLYRYGNHAISYLNFYNLLIQAVKYYPRFVARYNKIQEHIETTWKIAFKNSINQKEIRKNIDLTIMSKLFTQICLFLDSSARLSPSSSFFPNTKDYVEEQRKTLLYLYDLLKK